MVSKFDKIRASDRHTCPSVFILGAFWTSSRKLNAESKLFIHFESSLHGHPYSHTTSWPYSTLK